MAIKHVKKLIEDGGIIFMAYVGFMSQSLLSGMIDSLEKEETLEGISKKASHSIFTILIEMTQNIIKYSKEGYVDEINLNSNGLILVGKTDADVFYVHSQNIVTEEDSIKIINIIDEMNRLDEDEIKQRYRELRRSGSNSHAKGAGIGFYEIAKRASEIKYEFTDMGSNKYNFNLTVNIK